MAKKKTEAAAEQPVEAAGPETVDVVLRRDLQCGDQQLKVGDKLATVILEPGVSLNYLACAVENGFCGPAGE
jgi:hypothetical protein